MDQLRNFYELKIQSGSIPDEISPTRAEFLLAQETKDWFLVVVGNVEQSDAEPEVRIIPDALHQLTTKPQGSVTLAGVRSAKALRYSFRRREGDEEPQPSTRCLTRWRLVVSPQRAWTNGTWLPISPKLRVVWMPRPPLACGFAPSPAACPGYFRRVSGMGAPMRSKAWCCSLVGSVRTGTAAGVPGKRSSLRVRVPRWASRPRKLR